MCNLIIKNLNTFSSLKRRRLYVVLNTFSSFKQSSFKRSSLKRRRLYVVLNTFSSFKRSSLKRRRFYLFSSPLTFNL